MPLALSLPILIIGSLLIRCGVRSDARSNNRRAIVSALILALILGATIFYYLGIDADSGPRFDRHKTLRVEHSGYYVGESEDFHFVGTAPSSAGVSRPWTGFTHPALVGNEDLTIQPGASPNTPWLLRANVHRLPLRFNDRCVNVADSAWLKAKDEFVITYVEDSQTRYVAFRLTHRADKQSWSRGLQQLWRRVAGASKRENCKIVLEYQQGSVPRTKRVADAPGWVELKAVNLDNGQTLSTLATDGELGKIWANASTIPFARPSALRHVLDSIVWVREKVGDSSSRIGMLVDDAIRSDRNIHCYINDTDVAAGNFVAMELLSHKQAADFTITYGLFRHSPLALRFHTKLRTEKVTSEPPVWEASLLDPVVWPLPPHLDREFIILTLAILGLATTCMCAPNTRP